jgi:general secretion pathway protein L
MTARLLLSLPPRLAGKVAPATPAPSHWWLIDDAGGIRAGTSQDWPDVLPHPGPIIALAPVADVTLRQAAIGGLAPRQAAMAARLLLADGLADPVDALHLAIGSHDASGEMRPVAICGREQIQGWRDWLAALGITADHLVPLACLSPIADDTAGGALHITLGDQDWVRTRDLVFPADPALINLLTSGHLAEASQVQLDAALIALADHLPLDLLDDPFAPGTGQFADRRMRRRLGTWAALMAGISLALPLTETVRLKLDRQRLDRDSAAMVESALGRAPPLEEAVAALDADLARRGGLPGRASLPLAALLRALEPQPTVAINRVDWRGDGRLDVTLAAPRPDQIDPVAQALRDSGYRLVMTPRADGNGGALADLVMEPAS